LRPHGSSARPAARPRSSSLAVAALFLLIAAAAPRAAEEAAIRKEFRDAAAAGDFRRFDAAIERAEALIETLPTGPRRNNFRKAISIAKDIARVWHFEVIDANGMYYDDERLPFYYEHLVAEYSDYKRFIQDYYVVDRSGLPQFATHETRAFLLNLLENNRSKTP
jgi:hypothetical protein